MRYCFAFLFIFSLSTHAYIPRVDTIVKKMARNSGKQAYKIVRNVQFETTEGRIAAQETWLVKNGDQIKLKVESVDNENPWVFEILYFKNKRSTVSSSGNTKTYNRSEEFFEPLFHDRYHGSLKRRLINFKVLPTWANTIRAPSYKDGKTEMTPEPFVRLEPTEGAITYALGAQQNSNGDQWQTTLWVEQDSFLIRKGRLRSKAEFTNEDFQTFAGGLKLPRKQTISWDNHVARIQLISAETQVLPKKHRFDFSKKQGGRIPQDQIVKQFYSRFR